MLLPSFLTGVFGYVAQSYSSQSLTRRDTLGGLDPRKKERKANTEAMLRKEIIIFHKYPSFRLSCVRTDPPTVPLSPYWFG